MFRRMIRLYYKSRHFIFANRNSPPTIALFEPGLKDRGELPIYARLPISVGERCGGGGARVPLEKGGNQFSPQLPPFFFFFCVKKSGSEVNIHALVMSNITYSYVQYV